MVTVFAFLVVGLGAIFTVATGFVFAFAVVAAGMAAWYKLRRRPDRVELLLATAGLDQPEPQRPGFDYVCEKYDPGFAPTGAPPVAFRKSGDVK